MKRCFWLFPMGAIVLAGSVLLSGRSSAQSGRAAMHGFVAFEGLSYNDLPKSKVRAKVELRRADKLKDTIYTTETDEHGIYDFKTISLGEFTLSISTPGYKTYQTELYIPSDFICSLGTMMKKDTGKTDKPGK